MLGHLFSKKYSRLYVVQQVELMTIFVCIDAALEITISRRAVLMEVSPLGGRGGGTELREGSEHRDSKTGQRSCAWPSAHYAGLARSGKKAQLH